MQPQFVAQLAGVGYHKEDLGKVVKCFGHSFCLASISCPGRQARNQIGEFFPSRGFPARITEPSTEMVV
jgi:hypothetical protein